MNERRPDVILRLGSHSEKEYLIKTVPFLDGVIFGANLLEAMPWATTSLLLKVCGRTTAKPYYLDPMTYAFGTYPDEEGRPRQDLDWIKSDQKDKATKEVTRKFKRSYRDLSEGFGPPFAGAITQSAALTPADFMEEEKRKECCQRLLDYQRTRVRQILQEDKDLAEVAGADVAEPAALFAPYFYVEPSNWREWTQTNIDLAGDSAKLVTGTPVHALICADALLLRNDDFVTILKTDLPELGIQGVWLWFSKLNEHEADIEHLRSLRSLVETLSSKLAVYNLHGGYFSLALGKYGMSGISHGVGYGEQKDVVPVVGVAAPTVRYYVPDIHKRFGVPEVELSFKPFGVCSPEDFHKQICDCSVCKGIVKDSLQDFTAFGDLHHARPDSKRRTQTPAAAKRCRFHFLITRIRERDSIVRESTGDIVANLEAAYLRWEKVEVVAPKCEHLTRWADALRVAPREAP